MTSRETLSAPPINEVICGLTFEALPEIDPLLLGVYWETRRADFPNHQLQPPISDDATPLLLTGLPPIRTWLVSADDVFVLQIQTDRFYLNWRARGKEYPRFSDHEARPGLLTKLLSEFDAFSHFCRTRLGRAPGPLRVELAKVDHLRQGQHWRDFSDLARVIPWLDAFAHFSATPDPAVGLRFLEEREDGRLLISVDTALSRASDGSTYRVLKLETRISRPVTGELHAEFMRSNTILNDVFFAMIPKDQRDIRFAAQRSTP